MPVHERFYLPLLDIRIFSCWLFYLGNPAPAPPPPLSFWVCIQIKKLVRSLQIEYFAQKISNHI